jgi:hypothetical protein
VQKRFEQTRHPGRNIQAAAAPNQPRKPRKLLGHAAGMVITKAKPGRPSFVMSGVVETSLIIIGRRRARDSSTPLRCARNDTTEGYLSINEALHSRPNPATDGSLFTTTRIANKPMQKNAGLETCVAHRLSSLCSVRDLRHDLKTFAAHTATSPESVRGLRGATPLGFEPRITPPKGAVLPLHHGVSRLADSRFSTAQRKLQLVGRRT